MKTKQMNANRENRLLNKNGLLPKCKRIERVAGCQRVASFRNYPGLSSATDYRLIAQVRNIPGDGKGRDIGSFLACKCFSIFLALPPFWNLLYPERSKFSWTGHEQYPPRRTIVSRDFSLAFFLSEQICPTENHWRMRNTHTHSRSLVRKLYIRIYIHSARLNN